MLSSVFRFQPYSPATGWQTQIRSKPAEHKKSEPIPHREEVRISYVWWGKVDSNHRSYKQQIYSLSPLATREFPQIFSSCRNLFMIPHILQIVKHFFWNF